MEIEKINIEEKFALIQDHWNPRIVGELNGQHIKLAKIKGEFIWHKHKAEDEMFYVVKGNLIIELRDKKLFLQPGEFVIIPRGIEHKPVAEHEVELMLFEPAGTLNTGNLQNEFTISKLEKM